MTLARYLVQLFLGGLVAIATLLACLFNLIEFFEKLARVSHVPIQKIGYFFYLNAIPSFFDVLPVSAWLSTIFVLRVLTTNDSWDFLQFLGIVPRHLIKTLLLTALVVCCGILACREGFVLKLSQKAELFKFSQFKQQRQNYVLNSWFELEDNRFCFIERYDLVTGQGTGFMLISMLPDKSVQEVIRATSFTVDEQGGTLCLYQASLVSLPSQTMCLHEKKLIPTVFFFSIIRSRQQPPGLHGCMQQILMAQYLPEASVIVLWQSLADQLFYYASLLWYPLLTIVLFSLGLRFSFGWLLVLLPYPLTLVFSIAVRFAINGNFILLITFLAISFLAALFLWQKRA